VTAATAQARQNVHLEEGGEDPDRQADRGGQDDRAGRPLFESTHGYAAMWGVCAAAVLLSIPVPRRLQRERRS
jgi:hypothetical protein